MREDLRAGMCRYRLFGVTLATDVELACRPPVATGDPDLVVTLVGEAPAARWEDAEQRYVTSPRSETGQPDFRFFRLDDRDVIRIEGAMDFHIFDEGIVCHLVDERHRYLVEIALLGLVLAFWLERRGVATLHAAALAIEPATAVAFLAVGGTGKSSLATALTAGGAPLLTEDLLVVSWADGAPMVEPGLPQLRLWPDQAARFVADWESLDRPHPDFDKRRVPVGPGGLGTLAAGPTPLRRLYVLERDPDSGSEPVITPQAGRAATLELLRHSYLPHEAEGFGWQARRLAQLAELVAAVGVRRLRYPSGLDQLPRVREAILSDLAGGGSEAG